MSQEHKTSESNAYRGYIIGFVLSVVLTLIAYGLVVGEVMSGWPLTWAILFLAVLQLAVQLHYFLHLGSEAKPKWNVWAFWFMALVVLIIVLGSLWIMNNLDYHHGGETPQQKEQYLIEEEGYKP